LQVNENKNRTDNKAIYKTETKIAMNYQSSEMIWKPDKTKNWTILLELNNGAFELFQNWYIYFLKLFVQYPVIVIAEDDIVFKKLKSDQYASIQVHRSDYINISNASTYNTQLFRKLMSVRATHILMYLPYTRYLLFSDVDTVWLHDPIPYFKGNYDMWMPMDRKLYCAGFFAIRSNRETENLIRKWEEKLMEQPSVNQMVLNRLIQMSKNVKIAKLNESLFPSGDKYFKENSEKDRANAVIVHNNFIKGITTKIDRFKAFNLWSI
jgi:hypothetical protein